MANNLATLNAALAQAMRDPAYGTWATDEIDKLLTQSVSRLWPRHSRIIDASSVTYAKITFVADTYVYTLPTGVMAVSRADLYDSSSNSIGPISGRAWELIGDTLSAGGKIRISPQVVDAWVGGFLQLHGYGKYDLTTNLIPDDFVPLVLARARAEAYRRVLSDRERFKAWLSRNQTQNVSVNEMIQFVNEADQEALQLEKASKVWMKPLSGRVG